MKFEIHTDENNETLLRSQSDCSLFNEVSYLARGGRAVLSVCLSFMNIQERTVLIARVTEFDSGGLGPERETKMECTAAGLA